MGMEPEHVVGEQPFVDRVADRLRQYPPGVRFRPGDVYEVGEPSVRASVADEPRREIEVIVVEDDGGIGLRLELGQHSVRERSVDGDVAVLPGVMEAAIDVRCVGECPKVMLEEPKSRIRDHVVEPVVRSGVVRNEPKPVWKVFAGDLLDRLPSRFVDDGAILVGHRTRNPGHVVVRDEAAECRHESSAAATEHAVAVLVPSKRHRPAVRDDDQLPAFPHRQDPSAVVMFSIVSTGRFRRKQCRP